MFARELRNARQAAGLSVSDLAAKSGTSRSAISDYEHGQKVPRLDTANRILGALGMTLVAARLPHEPIGWHPNLDQDAIAFIDSLQSTSGMVAREARQDAAEIVEGYAAAEGLSLSWGKIKTIVDGWTVEGDPIDVRRVRVLARSVRASINRVLHGQRRPLQWMTNEAVVLPEERFSTVPRALDWYARALSGGADPALSAHLMNEVLLSEGYPWLFPPVKHAEEYRRAFVACVEGGNAAPLARVLASSVDSAGRL
ncbi:helix-turn-helix transcriptional regulator [Curtobacterium sp. MCPF17_031]|uniref:helix-turn-helix domain-containing protein n=1 Tax=Curtobacterium sp. MCPF17_031 TaxID=2175653 RepID=UPI000DA71A60|nr:helix-turn-helix transcriptional regulator [Curtobacterium sp. MCPF17_031]PZE36949.1 hypothetical protein DEJ31_07315 [Curtobacterium sp. MCPF17_031]